MKYDFENDVWPDSERVPYNLIQWWTFRYCQTICRRAIKDNYSEKWDCADEYQHAFHESQWEFLEGCPAIEALMFRFFLLVMLGRRGANVFSEKLNFEISIILSSNSLEKMLTEMGGQERKEFQMDLQILGIDEN